MRAAVTKDWFSERLFAKDAIAPAISSVESGLG
jgi:hypothetical protein